MSETSRPGLAFSTLGCPEWDAWTVVEHAAGHGWDGIEWRGGRDGTVQTDWPSERRRTLRASLDDAGIASIAVTAYTSFISPDPAVVRSSVDSALEHARLAAALGAPFVRVFAGEPEDDAADDVLDGRAIAALGPLVTRVRELGVGIAIEPHDVHVRSSRIRSIVDAVADPGLRVVWDVGNAWAAGEGPTEGLAAYDGRIAWVQLKDGTGVGDSWKLGDLGAGDVPLDDALIGLIERCIAAGRPVPPISLEWERAWHDHLDRPEIAFPRARAWLDMHVDAACAAAGTSP